MARRDPQIEDLLAKFVCVRLVQANNLDLTRFQFDYDLTFAAFFLNADGKIYGRYGTRTHRDAAEDVSVAGFRESLAAALALHQHYPNNKASLAGKQARPTNKKRPEEFSQLANFQPKLDYEGQVVKSCMHCHQIRDAERHEFRAAGKSIPDDVLFPYPMPDTIGLSFDPQQRAAVRSVTPKWVAAAAGFQKGDELLTLAGQPIVSIADMQWVLQHTADSAESPATVRRGELELKLTMKLSAGWRRTSDIAWRTTTWELRRMGFGGMWLVEATPAERQAAGVPDDGLALRVKHVGQYGNHAVAKNAGFLVDDLIVAFDGLANRRTESELLAHAVQRKRPGDVITVKMRHRGEIIERVLRLP